MTRTLGNGTSMIQSFSEALKESVLEICTRFAVSHKSRITAASLHGPWICGYADDRSDLHVLLLLHNYNPRLRAYHKTLGKIGLFILAVDRRLFERDVRSGWLGEFAAEKLTVPYEPLVNEKYLHLQEVKMKRRIVSELLENIILEFPELSHELHIHPEYFLYESMLRRAKLFPPLAFSFLNIFREDLKAKNLGSMIKGYLKAIDRLEEKNQVRFSDGYVRITRRFIVATRNRKLRVPGFLKSFQRAILLNVLTVLPKMMDPFLHEEEIFWQSHQEPKAEDPVFQLEDPRKYLLMPTPLGLIALSDKTSIRDFVRKTVPGGEVLGMKVEKIGGVLNDVYLLRLKRDQEEQKIVVKRFVDWSGFKWFPLALWTLGTKSFAVFGRSRLERQYAISQFLRNQGFKVPKVLYVSPQERLIFEEFVEGEELVKTIKRIISSKGNALEEVALVKEAGRRFAKAHRLGVSLGDSKPENIIVTRDGEMYFVDLEQATRDGDLAWDVAEFLYYSGHYVSPVSPAKSAEVIAKGFIDGYLEAGGKKKTITKAGSSRYTKVFSIFTPLHVILTISNLCKEMGKD